jgi:hypothetical protein
MNIGKLAKESGFTKQKGTYVTQEYFGGDLEKFAELVRKETIDDCANLCKAKHANGNYMYDHRDDCAAAILELK